MKIELCKYKNDAKGAFSFTFDDGCYRESSTEVIENFKRVYEEYGVKIKATVGITVGFMHEWIIKFWQDAVSAGYFEIGSHSVGHDLSYLESTPYEVREKDARLSKEQLKEMFPGQTVETYILPGGTYDQKGLEVLRDYYLAVRCNRDGINYPGKINWLDIKCLTAMLKKPFSYYTDYIDEVIKTGGWGVQMNHWITHKEEDTFHSQKAESFHDECSYIGEKVKNGELWASSFEDVAKYIRKYEQSDLNVIEIDGKLKAEIIPNSDTPEAILNTPLTISIETENDILLYGKDGGTTRLTPDKNGKILVETVNSIEFEPVL